MFTTFYNVTPSHPGGDDGSTNKTTPASVNRPKRNQVRHACDWCKMMRIKCDHHRPCAPCRQAARDCTRSGENRFRSLAEAVDEIKRLRAQVRAFEGTQQAQQPAATSSASPVQPEKPEKPQQQQYEQQSTPPDIHDTGQGAQQQQQYHQDQRTPKNILHEQRQMTHAALMTPPADPPAPTMSLYSSPDSSASTHCKQSTTSASRNAVWVDSIPYSVTSMPFFLSRMEQFLQTVPERPQLPLELDAFSCAATPGPGATGAVAHNTSARLVDYTHAHHDTTKRLTNGFLPRSQETLFHDLFWQTHYFSFPILNEGQFRRDYKSLWDEAPSGGLRKASPLIDIITALCIQLGAFLVRQRNHSSDPSGHGQNDEQRPSPESDTPSLGGFQYYRRCQDAIDLMTESPSIEHVQCSIFSIVYLYEAGLLNTAHVMVGKAIMMAMILGLPNEPQADELEPQREVARRTWWSLYILDSKLSIEAGRPPLIGPSHSSCRLPSDSNEVARWLGPHYSFDDSCPTWLGFQTQTLKLLDAVISVRSALYAKYDSIVDSNGYQDFVSNTAAREECAFLLTERIKALKAWAKQVPGGYRVARCNGESFSTDRAQLEFESDMIIHCQRQRLLLELQYHTYCMSLYQLFVCFTPSEGFTPVSDTKAAAALAHAMTLTSIIHQTLTNSEALSGIYHVFRWQKNALFTMLGYAYTFPMSGSAAATRKSIEMAIKVIEMYRDILPEAGPVAIIGRVLAENAGHALGDLSTGNRSESSPSLTSSVATPITQPSIPIPAPEAQPVELNKAGPTANHDLFPIHQDWNMMAMLPSTDRNLSSPYQLSGEDGANTEGMDMIWATLDEGGLPSGDWWIPMSDSII